MCDLVICDLVIIYVNVCLFVLIISRMRLDTIKTLVGNSIFFYIFALTKLAYNKELSLIERHVSFNVFFKIQCDAASGTTTKYELLSGADPNCNPVPWGTLL